MLLETTPRLLLKGGATGAIYDPGYPPSILSATTISSSIFTQFCPRQGNAQVLTWRTGCIDSAGRPEFKLCIGIENGRDFLTLSAMQEQGELEKLLVTAEPPELGPGARRGVQMLETLNRTLGEMLSRSKIPEERQQLIRALVLLWHDHLEAAHVIAQAIDNADGAFVHGIMHRREPDYGNAKYWFRHVGKHPAFAAIVARVRVLLDAKTEPALLKRLVPIGEWDAFAFVDLCEEAANGKAGDAAANLLREIQRIETEALLETFCRSR